MSGVRPTPSAACVVQRDLLALNAPRTFNAGSNIRSEKSADAQRIFDALEPLIAAGQISMRVKGDENRFTGWGVSGQAVAAALTKAGFPKAPEMGAALVDPHNVTTFSGNELFKNRKFRREWTKQNTLERATKRELTPVEENAARGVFGSALKLDGIVLSEGGPMTVGGYARTVYNRVFFTADAFKATNFLGWLIHELTHVWQYQQGAPLIGMAWEAVAARYLPEDDAAADAMVEKFWSDGLALDELATEAQADIVQRFYEGSRKGAYVKYVETLRNGTHKQHRHATVTPLPAGTLDVGKLNREYDAKVEQSIILLLRKNVAASNAKATMSRFNEVLQLFRKLRGYSAGTYVERIIERRKGDVLADLVHTRLSTKGRERILALLRS